MRCNAASLSASKRNTITGVVLLGRGTVTQPLVVKVHRISKTAQAKLEAVGGKVELIA